jgi:hypothetical protein
MISKIDFEITYKLNIYFIYDKSDMKIFNSWNDFVQKTWD